HPGAAHERDTGRHSRPAPRLPVGRGQRCDARTGGRVPGRRRRARPPGRGPARAAARADPRAAADRRRAALAGSDSGPPLAAALAVRPRLVLPRLRLQLTPQLRARPPDRLPVPLPGPAGGAGRVARPGGRLLDHVPDAQAGTLSGAKRRYPWILDARVAGEGVT